MRKIEVLGPGCPKCKKLHDETQQAAYELGLACDIRKITDISEISGYGVMMTPALVVDGVVKSVGKVPSREEIKKLISNER